MGEQKPSYKMSIRWDGPQLLHVEVREETGRRFGDVLQNACCPLLSLFRLPRLNGTAFTDFHARNLDELERRLLEVLETVRLARHQVAKVEFAELKEEDQT